eukprot:2232866-Amphidinium_carterae.1
MIAIFRAEQSQSLMQNPHATNHHSQVNPTQGARTAEMQLAQTKNSKFRAPSLQHTRGQASTCITD